MKPTRNKDVENTERKSNIFVNKKARKFYIQINGITLISLVITIIILLILAGVTISVILGDNGLIIKAQQTSDEEKQKQEKSQIEVNQLEAKLASSDSDTIEISKTELNALINNIVDKKIEENNQTTNNKIDESTKNLREAIEQKIINSKLEQYPVGSIYISTSSTNPSEFIGGTWESYGEGRTLVGIDTSQTEFATVNQTGGNKSFNNAHTHPLSSNGYARIGTNGSNIYYQWKTIEQWTANWSMAGSANNVTSTATMNGGSVLGGKTDSAGSDQSLLQPYIVTYMWKRVS